MRQPVLDLYDKIAIIYWLINKTQIKNNNILANQAEIQLNRPLSPKENEFIQYLTSDIAEYLKTADINRLIN